MGKMKELATNNEMLLDALGKAKKRKLITPREIKAYEDKLKKTFPHIGYDLSSLYKDELKKKEKTNDEETKKVKSDEEVDETEDDEEEEDEDDD